MSAMNSKEPDTAGNTADGPPPMKDFKPAKMRPNSVDQWQTHQAEYEDRGKCSTISGADRVRLHNTAYPKLRDELDKRRSLTTVTAVQHTNAQNLCERDACLKLKNKSYKNSRVQATGIGSKLRKRRSRYTKRNKSQDSLTSGCCSRCRVAIARLVQTVYDKETPAQGTVAGTSCKKRKYLEADPGGMSRNVRKKGKKMRIYSPKTLKIRDDIDGNVSGDNSSGSCKKFESRKGSRANSIASELSLPSYNSSISLNLENEPMVK